MKAKGLYEIHALIGKCHLHNKKKSLYSICLKMGTKWIASTEYKMPTEDEINFNTELILKIDKTTFESGNKVPISIIQFSLIVAMQMEDKEKKIIGSVFANYKQKGLQTLRVAQCSCKDKSFQVNVQFEVVNIQVHHNNLNHNKFQSPNNSQMKDLKKALTISRQKQLAKSSRTKLSTGIKSPVEKTQSKLNKQKIQSCLKEQLSPDLSCLTTKISPHTPKSAQQSKQLITDLKIRIRQLESELKEGFNQHKKTRKQVSILQNEVNLLRRQNECLLQILTFEQEKSSAALEYISYLTQKISQNNLFDNHLHQYFDLIQTIKNTYSPNVNDIRSTIPKKQYREQYSFYNVQPIEEKAQHINEYTQKFVQQVEEYKFTILELKQKIIDLQNHKTYNTNTIAGFKKQIFQLQQSNSILVTKNEQLRQSINDFQATIDTLKLELNKLEAQDNALQKILSQTTNNYQKSKQQLKDTNLKYESTLKDKKLLQQNILKLQQRIIQLQQLKQKQQQMQQELAKLHSQKPVTPKESQILMKKTRFQDGDQIENIIKEMNKKKSPKKKLSQQGRDLLVSSRKREENEPFLSRNKSQSLLKDLEQSDPQQLGVEQIEHVESDQREAGFKNVKKISIPEHKKLVQKYNYDYDIDSLNYFNNFEENHERMEMSGDNENNSSQIENDPPSKS